MAISMIVVGVVLTVFGVINLAKGDKQDKSKPQAVVERVTPAPVPAKEQKVGTDDAKTKGNKFEAYVVDVFKYGDRFRILEWHQGVTTPDGNYAEDELNPDLKVALPREESKDITFWVECKYRSWIGEDVFSLPQYQIERYRKHQGETRRKVLIALGVAGESEAPKELYIIPIDSLAAEGAFSYADLQPFKVVNPRENIRENIETYFKTVFARSRKK